LWIVLPESCCWPASSQILPGQFPAIVAPQKSNFSTDGSVPFPFRFGSSFNVRAFPQPASNIPLADTTVPAADYSVSEDPPRAYWCC
jgi:hypothetical protein